MNLDPSNSAPAQVNQDITASIRSLRRECSFAELLEDNVEPDPFQQFGKWLKDAINTQIYEPNAMCLSTCTLAGKPSSRMVLLKTLDDKGFVFFTNYESRKGNEIFENPNVSLVFYWAELHRSVRVEGTASKITESESFEYFSSRPRGAQIGAWASEQSAILEGGRSELEERTKVKSFVV
jgi:pyridoxamine 5'-phosphate oxidase